MNQTAVLAIDLSPAAEPLLECAAAGLRRWGVSRLLITHVIRIGYGQELGERSLQDIKDWLEARARRLRDDHLSVDVEVRTAASPAAGILSAGIEAHADLVVVGTRSHNLASRLFLGSVARDMVRNTSVPLLLQWLEPTDHGGVPGCTVVCADPLRHVLLATDLSKHAGAAERAAVALAPLGGRGEALVVEGDPHEVITRVAKERDCSLIVCGKHGQHWVQSMVIGSTASRLCEMAGRPVLLVPLAQSP